MTLCTQPPLKKLKRGLLQPCIDKIRSDGLKKLKRGLLQTLTGAWLGLIAVTGAYAEDSAPEPRYYTVEMIAFSYEQPDENLSESWPEDIQVELPTAYQQLYDIDEISPALMNRKKTVETRVKTLEDGSTETEEIATGVLPLTAQQRADIRNNRWPDQFYLPDNRLQLTYQKGRLERRDNLRVMFHKAWKMPIYDKDNSIPLHVRGGEKYDNLYEFEGSINLSVARYLHLDTQLYLREFDVINPNVANPTGGLSPLLSPQSSLTPEQETAEQPNPSLAMLGFRQYRLKNVIPMQQSRRMRSGDLHYIDHPRFGLLVKLTPVDDDAQPILIR